MVFGVRKISRSNTLWLLIGGEMIQQDPNDFEPWHILQLLKKNYPPRLLAKLFRNKRIQQDLDFHSLYPIGSMYGIFTYIWLKFMVFM